MPIEARNRALPDWFTRIRTRQMVLPRFQRFEAWDYARVTQIFNTILQDLPVGAGLVLEIGDEEPFISRTLKGAPESGERITEHLLDGQQRLTALWRGLHNNYEDRTFFVIFKHDEESGLPYYIESLARWKQVDDKEFRPFWANKPKEQWSRRMIPLHFFAPDTNSPQAYKEWARQSIESSDEREEVADLVAEVRQKFTTFNLPFMSLPVSTPKQTALDVFIKMNTSASPLTTYDIVVAQVEAGMDTSLHDLVTETKKQCPNIASYYRVEDLTLYASALLLEKSPTDATYMAKDFGSKLLENWDIFLSGVKKTVSFLEEERVFDASRLPTDVVIPVLVALWGRSPNSLDAEGRARNELRKYLWRSFFTNRYEKSTNSRSLADFIDLKAKITGSVGNIPAVFNDVLHPLPQEQELIDSGWPVRKDRLARAILALALKHGGIDLADGSAVTRENLAKREYHHLFPFAHLSRLSVPDSLIYRSLNCALVTWSTNRNISDKEPEKYLAQRRDGTSLGESEIKARLATHYIPYDEMVVGNYDAFLIKRAKLIHEAMTTLCDTGGT